MKIPKLAFKTQIWSEDMDQMQEAIIKVLWAILIITALNVTIKIASGIETSFLAAMLIITLCTIVIYSQKSYKKSKKKQ